MKRLLLVIMVLLGMTPIVSAQQRTKIIDGVYLVRYGNTAVVEDDINQMTWNLSVTAEAKTDNMGRKVGEYVYTFACGNKYTKGLTKFALKGAIVTTLTSATVGAGAITADVAATIALIYYDDVCDYYKDIME
ncbi:MAG: hypothetical protein IJ920_10240 [Paludibacteraceae bacterium]|nr:hypothetical protein [Paludibacteraceae bacterium]